MSEKEEINSIRGLFEKKSYIRIPAYQRAYTWEKEQWKQFLEDLIEQKGKVYYLGQFLFEEEGNTMYIIDGQQRLTTTVIFMSVISVIKESRNIENDIRILYLNDSFKTIDDDQIIFKKVTQKNFNAVLEDAETLSQKRIANASVYFKNELVKLSDNDLNEIQITLENAVISTFIIKNKAEAVQVFEYQNNRGKDLTHFEIIKAYLMHQIYLNSIDQEQANNLIFEIQSIVSKTYRYLESVEDYFTETELLNNFCDLYYNTNSDIDSIKKKLAEQKDKLNWIKDFFEDFSEISFSARSVIQSKDYKLEIRNLFFVGNEVNWKIVLLAIFNKGDNTGDFYKNILKLLEILCFKMKLGDFRTDYLPNYVKLYYKKNYGIENLYKDIRKAADVGFKWYWNNNDSFKNIIEKFFDDNTYHYYRNIIKYVLWQYENSLRKNSGSGSLMDFDLYRDYTIEHIKPQTPANETYTEDFEKNFLHLAGNLALLTQTQNSVFSNKNFEKKRDLFQLTTFTSYTEIRSKDCWTEFEIKERHKNISDFIKEYFNIKML
jgi:uncharacterized protein with ParB-like and HNH nuclease domain